jgi:hypothetical protein
MSKVLAEPAGDLAGETAAALKACKLTCVLDLLSTDFERLGSICRGVQVKI